jgi:transcription antitermination factor NusG
VAQPKQKMFGHVKTEMEMNSSPSAELCSQPNTSAWFCARTHLKHEHIAAAHLGLIAGVEVFNPQLRVLRPSRVGRRWNMESLFPNYIFVRFDLETMLEKIVYSPGIKMVLRFGGRVPEIPEPVIADLRRGLSELSSEVVTDMPAEGEEVEIVGGAFRGMKASVAHVLPGKLRAQILLEVMGRQVPAVLSLDMVLFKRRDAAQFALSRVESSPNHALGSLSIPPPA